MSDFEDKSRYCLVLNQMNTDFEVESLIENEINMNNEYNHFISNTFDYPLEDCQHFEHDTVITENIQFELEQMSDNSEIEINDHNTKKLDSKTDNFIDNNIPTGEKTDDLYSTYIISDTLNLNQLDYSNELHMSEQENVTISYVDQGLDTTNFKFPIDSNEFPNEAYDDLATSYDTLDYQVLESETIAHSLGSSSESMHETSSDLSSCQLEYYSSAGSEHDFIIPEEVNEDYNYKISGLYDIQILDDEITENDDNHLNENQTKTVILVEEPFDSNVYSTQPNEVTESEPNEPKASTPKTSLEISEYNEKCAEFTNANADFSCKMCKKVKANRKDLETHLCLANGEVCKVKTYACPLCDYLTRGANYLHSHLLRTHSGHESLTCELCDYTCDKNKDMVEHIMSHTSDNPYSCDQCSYKTNYSCNLTKHLREHTGEKPYSCNFCPYTTKYSSNLKKHLRSHTGEKPFSCKFCVYKCTNGNRLVIHLRTHTGEKPC